MDKIKLYILLFLIPIFNACEKDYVDGDCTVKGTIMYEDVFTKESKKVPEALITVEFKKKDKGDEIESYEIKATDGAYELNFLKKNVKYTIKISSEIAPDFTGTALNYSIEDNLTLNKILIEKNFVLTRYDKNRLLKVNVTDSQNNPLDTATVCLYRNKNLLIANEHNCAGVRTGITDKSGNVYFSGLDTGTYYINSYGAVGTVQLVPQEIYSVEVVDSVEVYSVKVKLEQKE